MWLILKSCRCEMLGRDTDDDIVDVTSVESMFTTGSLNQGLEYWSAWFCLLPRDIVRQFPISRAMAIDLFGRGPEVGFGGLRENLAWIAQGEGLALTNKRVFLGRKAWLSAS